MKRLLLSLCVALGVVLSVQAGIWDTATPANTDPISQGDDRIREAKTAIQEALRGGAADGVEAVFPGGSPSTGPIYRYRGLKGTTGARPAATYGGLYWNTTTGTLQRSSYTATDTGAGWEDITENAEYEAIHAKVAQSLASAAGVITLPETANNYNVTGTEEVTSITGWSAGVVTIKWSSARNLKHASNLLLRQAVDRKVVADDVSVFLFSASGQVREIAFYGAGMGKLVGESMLWNTGTAPAGFLEEDGSSLLRTDYPGLFAVIGTNYGAADGTHFNLPNTRGRFVRGYNNGSGTDPDAAGRTANASGGLTGDNVGTLQADELKAHTHQGTKLGTVAVNPGLSDTATDGSTATGSTGGNETRPKNITKMYVIKY